MFKLLKESWLSLTLILVILATVCTATFAWQVDQKQMPLTATSALVNVKLNLANNEESDPGVLNLTALQDGQTAYIPFKMQNVSNIQTEVNFRVLVKNADGEEIEMRLRIGRSPYSIAVSLWSAQRMGPLLLRRLMLRKQMQARLLIHCS